MKAASVRLSAFGLALVGSSVAACAGIVGADFGDVQADADGGTGIKILDDGGHPFQPPDDAGFDAEVDSSKIIIVADGGMCPTGSGLTACDVGGTELCVDLSTDPSHCNSCTTVCPSDPHGTAVCVTGACTYACRGGFSLCDAGDGCCSVTSPVTDASTQGAGDSAPPPADDGIPCASTYCSVTANNGAFCCGANQSSPAGDFCANNQTPSGELNCTYQFSCGSAADCSGGNICCYDTNDYSEDGDQNGESSFCQSTCPSFDDYVQFCNPATTGECTNGQTCTGEFQGNQGELETTYHYCK